MPSPDATKKPGIEKLKRIVNSFLARPDARAFAEPVDWRALELYDYPEVIKNMQDLGTIKRKLERNQYENGAQVAKDIRLVWSNCMTYNAEESELWLVAKDLSQRFEKKYESLRNQFDMGEASEDEEEEEFDDEMEGVSDDEEDDDEEEEGEDEDEAEFEDEDAISRAESATTPRKSSSKQDLASLDAKARLASSLLLLNGIELGYVVRTIETECPKAIEKGESLPEKMEIIVDELSPELFTRLSKYANEKADARRTELNISTSAPAINDISNKRKRKR